MVAMEVAKYAINIALKGAQSYIKEAQKYSKIDSERCQAYLQAATKVVEGLMSEAEEIVSEARLIDLNKPRNVARLVKRADSYLHHNILKRELNKIMGGLIGIRDGLQHASDREINKLLRHVKKNRNSALAHYDELLLDIEIKLNELSGKMLAREKGVSGLGANYLLAIFNYLRSNNTKDWIRQQLDVAVSEAAVNLENESSDWYRLLRDISASVERIKIEFGRPI